MLGIAVDAQERGYAVPSKFTDDPVCPYCKYVDTGFWEHEMHDGESYDTFCEECGKEFRIIARAKIEYKTMECV